MRVTVVDYGVGNLLSVARALEHVGATATLAEDPADVAGAERLVLPGVGAFGHAMAALSRRGLVAPLRAFGATGRPFLGICLGMQLMLEASEEFGRHEGLGLMAGGVMEIPRAGRDGRRHKIPHIGWNALHPVDARDWKGTVLDRVVPGDPVYFVHSFVARPDTATDVAAACDYDGVSLAAVIGNGNMWGCQFHPEKSGPVGLKILTAFAKL